MNIIHNTRWELDLDVVKNIHVKGFPLLHMEVYSSKIIPQNDASISCLVYQKCFVPFSIHLLYQQATLCLSLECEEDKQSSHKNPYTEFEQVNYDFILAIAMQDQERAFTMLSTTESESESESEEDKNDSSFNNGDGDGDDAADFFRSRPFEGDFGFLEGEESNDDEDMEEDDMDLDVDELTYEELIALGELIGEGRRGLSTSEIPLCLHPYISHSAESKTGIDRCVICQVEYEEGEALVALKCEHPYHADCISKWLQIKKACPICSTEVSTSKDG